MLLARVAAAEGSTHGVQLRVAMPAENAALSASRLPLRRARRSPSPRPPTASADRASRPDLVGHLGEAANVGAQRTADARRTGEKPTSTNRWRAAQRSTPVAPWSSGRWALGQTMASDASDRMWVVPATLEHMGDRSNIEWTEATWNPVTGCNRISEGCANCYALALAKRLKAMGAEKYQNDGDPRTSGIGFDVTLHPAALAQPLRWRSPRVVFVNSMSDLFHARVPVSFIEDVFDVIRETPQHTYQVLTKRAVRARRLSDRLNWPANMWLGVSVETSKYFPRVDELRQVPAAVRFLSCEPLLGDIRRINLKGVDWVIAGGESGPNFRPMQLSWARGIRDACVEAHVPFFFKQWGGRTPKRKGRLLEGRTWDEMPLRRPA